MTQTSIDPREVAHYHALADTWWDQAGPFWPLHRLNKLRIDWIVEQLDKLELSSHAKLPLSGLRVLDVGCGGGILSESLAELGADVTGIDVVEKNIHIAQHHARSAGHEIDYHFDTAENLASSGRQFDVVFNMEVVEHVADLSLFMQACCQLVRPGGAMFVATINRNYLAWLVAIFGAEVVLGWLPKGTHQLHMLRKPQEVKACLSRGELQVSSQTGVAVNPFTRNMSLTRFMGVNYMLVARKA